jgi:chaperone LolA
VIARPFSCLLASVLTVGVWADGIGQLRSFLSSTRTLEASFSQTVSQGAGKPPQTAGGTMAISRPGKFNWAYTKPYAQRVVGDGQKLWMFDPDLNQVTVKQLDAALGQSPAALLADRNDLEHRYTLANLPDRDGLAWVEAKPKSRDNSFERVRIGFKDGLPAAMELNDNFGQQTTIRFSNTRRNTTLPASLFSFTPPKGADVVSAD